MEEKAVGGVRWTLLTYAVSKAITFGATVVLSRILVPADFGVVMLAFAAINVVGLFGDLGLGATVVVRQDLDRRSLGTVLTLLLASGTVLAILLVATAPALSSAFHEPRLRGVLMTLAPLTIVGSFNWFYQWLLQRDLEFRKRFVGFAVQTAAYAFVAIGSAAFGAGIWSIVAGHLAGQVSMAVVYLVLARAIRPALDMRLARDLVRTSRGFLLQTAARLLQGDADYVAVGRTLGAARLGLYSMAFRLGELLYLAIADPVAKVTFPGFTRMRLRGEAVRHQYVEVLRLVALVTFPTGAVLSAVAVPFTRLVYGPHWLGMTGALSIMAVWGAVRCVQSTVEWLLNSVGGETQAGVVATVLLVVQVPLFFVAADSLGIAGVAWVLLGGVSVSLLVLVLFVAARIGVGLGEHVRAMGPVALASTGAWLAARAVSGHTPGSALVAFAIPTALGVVVFLALVSVFVPGVVATTLDQARRAFLTPSGPPAAGPPTSDPAVTSSGAGGVDRF
ncbi:MAG: lipopolysaccharide biosynthesis protein [Acidimicrobiales bacterium]|nr:lipopolysaccharide biosynthesis protein [Acidimicrobiales bacterium]